MKPLQEREKGLIIKHISTADGYSKQVTGGVANKVGGEEKRGKGSHNVQ